MGTGPNTHVGERYAVQSTSFYPLQGKKGEQINGKKKGKYRNIINLFFPQLLLFASLLSPNS